MNMYYREKALQILEDWYKIANDNLEIIAKYPNSVWYYAVFLGKTKAKLDAKCKRAYLKAKTKGLIFHDNFSTMPDRCWRKHS